MSTIEIIGKAQKAAKIILAAAKSSTPCDHFGRTFDDLFENGDGHEVFLELGKMYRNDEKLLAAARRVDHWTGVDHMLDVLKKHEERNPTLF